MYKKHFYTAVILLSFLTVGIQPALGINIPGNDQYYDIVNGEYVLNQDINETIHIVADGITIDGNGHTIELNSYGQTEYGVALAGRQNVTVQNLNVTKCNAGIALNPSGYCNVINSTFSDCLYGIFMQAAGTCTIEGNIISDNDNYGILMQSGSVYNTLKNNTIKDNNFVPLTAGLCIASGSYSNTIYNNNFINNSQNAAVYQPENKFDLNGSGNYWDDYIGVDNDDDGIGDTLLPHLDLDDYPWVVKNGWIEPAVLIGQMVATVESMNLQNGIDNSLDAKLDAAVNALDDVNQNNDVAAINSLNAFINAVEAQRDNKITSAQADILIGDATDIITLLGG